MQTWQIALIVTAAAIAAIGVILAIAYYVILPKKLIKSIRGGGDSVSLPPDFDAIAARVEKTENLTYRSDFPDSVYDLYRPKNAVSNLPLVIWVHGGFFIAGDKRGVSNVATCIADAGYAVAAINYAVAPEHKYPSALRQLDDFVRGIGDLDGIDPAKIILAGDSAGGQIVAQYAALTSGETLRMQMNFTPSLDRQALKAVALVCAPIDVGMLFGVHKALDLLLPLFGRVYYGSGKWYKKERFRSTKLFDYVTADYPSAFLTDGNHVSFGAQNALFGAKLRAVGVDVEELYFGAEEGKVEHEYLFRLDEQRARDALKRLIGFLDEKTR